jgi:hypothetical protein
MEAMVNRLFNKEAMDEVTPEGFGLFRIRMKGIPTPMYLRFYRIPGEPGIRFTQSHFIKTPAMGEPHETNASGGDDELDAAWRASVVLTIHYVVDMKKWTPDASWLVENKQFTW